MKVPAIFNNKILCYAMLFLATMNIIGYLTTGAYECLLVFSVAYAGVNHLCKNQTCAILGGLFAANLLWGCGRVKETFVEAMKGSEQHANDASASATKAALEAMKEAASTGSDKDANAADAAAQLAAKAAEAAAKITEEKKCKGKMTGEFKDFSHVWKDGACTAEK